MEQIVSGSFKNHQLAESAVQALGKAGFPLKNVSILAQNLQTTEQVQGFVTVGDVAKGGVGIGAWWGGLFGVLIGSAFLWIPGFGPLVVMGALASSFLGMLEGAALGAVSGGLLGALVGYGMSREKALKYESIVREGNYLVMAHGNEALSETARQVLEDVGATDTEVLTKTEPVPA